MPRLLNPGLFGAPPHTKSSLYGDKILIQQQADFSKLFLMLVMKVTKYIDDKQMTSADKPGSILGRMRLENELPMHGKSALPMNWCQQALYHRQTPLISG